jgi:hypothetical protein
MGVGPHRILAASVHLCRAGLNSWGFGRKKSNRDYIGTNGNLYSD